MNSFGKCGFCGEQVLDKDLNNNKYCKCLKCEAPYHVDCYSANGKCSIYGCGSKSISFSKDEDITALVPVRQGGGLENIANKPSYDMITWDEVKTKYSDKICIETTKAYEKYINDYRTKTDEIYKASQECIDDGHLWMLGGALGGMAGYFASLGIAISTNFVFGMVSIFILPKYCARASIGGLQYLNEKLTEYGLNSKDAIEKNKLHQQRKELEMDKINIEFRKTIEEIIKK